MTRALLALSASVLLLLSLGAACSGEASDDALGTVVGRRVELGDWVYTGEQSDTGALLDLVCTASKCRVLLTIHFAGGAVRDIHVTPSCYQVVAIGDRWPHDSPDCAR